MFHTRRSIQVQYVDRCRAVLTLVLSPSLFVLFSAPLHDSRCVMSGADVEVYLSQVHDGSVSSGFRALYEERLLLDVTLLIEEHHFQVPRYN